MANILIIEDDNDIAKIEWEDLYEHIWGLESMGDNITVAVHINRLREKIRRRPTKSAASANRLGRRIPFLSLIAACDF